MDSTVKVKKIFEEKKFKGNSDGVKNPLSLFNLKII